MAKSRSKIGKGMTHRIEPYRDERGRHRWRVIVRNGNNVAQCSQGRGYSRPASALKAIVKLLEAYQAGTVEIMANPFSKSQLGKK